MASANSSDDMKNNDTKNDVSNNDVSNNDVSNVGSIIDSKVDSDVKSVDVSNVTSVVKKDCFNVDSSGVDSNICSNVKRLLKIDPIRLNICRYLNLSSVASLMKCSKSIYSQIRLVG